MVWCCSVFCYRGVGPGGLIDDLGKTWPVLNGIAGRVVVILTLAAAAVAVTGLRRNLVVWLATLLALLMNGL